jgi:hypothetical protein
MVLAVDFDGTVSLGQYPDLGPVNSKLVQFLKQRKDMGDKLILGNTNMGKAFWCRNRKRKNIDGFL